MLRGPFTPDRRRDARVDSPGALQDRCEMAPLLLPETLMRSEPPPIPSDYQSEDTNSFATNAALAALIAPLLVIGLCVASKNVIQANPNSRAAVLTIAAVSLIFLIVGPILGLLALVTGKPFRHKTILWRSICGILLSGLLLAIAIPNFVQARTKAIARNQAAIDDLKGAVRDFNNSAVEKLHEGEGESPDLDKLQKSLQKATDNSSGETSAILRGSQSYLKRMQAVQETYTAAGRQITSAHILQPSDIRQRADLQAKTKIVQEFMAANRAFSAFLSANEENYRKDLVQASVSPRALEAALKGFRQKAAAQTPHLLKIRET